MGFPVWVSLTQLVGFAASIEGVASDSQDADQLLCSSKGSLATVEFFALWTIPYLEVKGLIVLSNKRH